MKIYKYSSLQTAIKIVDKSRVLLNSPYNFNDITDSLINISHKTQKRTINLIENYGMFLFLHDFFYSLDLSKPFKRKWLVKFVKKEMSIYLKLLDKNRVYKPMRMLKFIYYLVRSKMPSIEELKSRAEYLYENRTIPNIRSLRGKARISCFSKTPTNLYSWDVHGDGHKGICIEFEENRHFFKGVEYSTKDEEMDIYYATSKILAYNLLEKDLTYHEKDFADVMLRPFFIKNISYKPEDEIRCLLSDNESEKIGYIKEDDKTFLNMKISRVFIGCKTPNTQELLDFLKLCDSRKIPISYMTFDPINKSLKSITNSPET